MNWKELKFGKYKGKSLPQIIFSDPDYFLWGCEENVFDKHGLQLEANDLFYKITNIKIPDNAEETKVVEYVVHPTVHKIADMSIIEKSTPQHEGSSTTFRKDRIDLSVGREISKYDKKGGSILLKSLKKIMFGNEKVKFTKNKCEAFFSNKQNFMV